MALAPAQRAGLVAIDESRIRFTHPFFASVVYGQATEAQRRRLHRHLASVVTQPEERARHAALGTAQTDEGIADELDAAAELAGRRGARDTAAELLELAVRLTPVSAAAKRPERLVAAARYWFDAGDFTRSEEMLEQMLGDTLDGRVRAQALQLLGQIHARRSSFTRAMQVALEALDLAADDQELRAGIGLDLAYYHVSLGDFAGAERSARAAVASAEGTALTGALADALAVLTMAEFLCGRGLDEARIRRARDMEDPWRVRTWQCRPMFLHGLLLLWTCHPEEARATLERLHAETRERGEENPMPFLCLYLDLGVFVARGSSGRRRHYAAEGQADGCVAERSGVVGDGALGERAGARLRRIQRARPRGGPRGRRIIHGHRLAVGHHLAALGSRPHRAVNRESGCRRCSARSAGRPGFRDGRERSRAQCVPAG